MRELKRGSLQVGSLNLPGTVAPCPELGDPLQVDIETGDLETATRERAGDRQADIAETYDRDAATLNHGWQKIPVRQVAATIERRGRRRKAGAHSLFEN